MPRRRELLATGVALGVAGCSGLDEIDDTVTDEGTDTAGGGDPTADGGDSTPEDNAAEVDADVLVSVDDETAHAWERVEVALTVDPGQVQNPELVAYDLELSYDDTLLEPGTVTGIDLPDPDWSEPDPGLLRIRSPRSDDGSEGDGEETGSQAGEPAPATLFSVTFLVDHDASADTLATVQLVEGASEIAGPDGPLQAEFAAGGVTVDGEMATEEIDSDITEDTTLESDTCYRVTDDIEVDARLTIEPGACLEFVDGVGMEIVGVVVAEGTGTRPILFTGTEVERGWWNGIYLDSTSDENVLDQCVLEYGGDGLSANLEMGTDGLGDEGTTVLRNSTLRRSAGYGLRLGGAVGRLDAEPSRIEEAEGNTYENNADGPARVRSSNVHGFNWNDEFLDSDEPYLFVEASDVDGGAVTWDALAVPYRFDGDTVIEAGTLTIERGTTMEFTQESRLEITEDGVIEAIGSESRPVVFTDVIDTQGSWEGIRVESEDLRNRIEHAVVEYGGRGDDGSANVKVGASAVSGHGYLTLVDSDLRHSGGYAVYVEGGSDTNADICTANEFANNAEGNCET